MSEKNLFDIAIATLFAVEFFEGSIIVGQYRTILLRLPEWEDRRDEGLRCIYRSALFAILVALIIIIAVAIPLGILATELDPRIGEIIEGCSKFVAAFFILMLSLKIPTWLGLYPTIKKERELGLTLKEIRFNVVRTLFLHWELGRLFYFSFNMFLLFRAPVSASYFLPQSWNIWREVIEIGVFLLPIILGTGALAIPLSGVAGAAIGLIGGGVIYFANQRLKSKRGLAMFMSVLLVFLSSGLMMGAMAELEDVAGSTRIVWEVQNQFWSSKQLPMILLKPFGYSSARSVLEICTYWCWLVVAALLHYFKYWRAMRVKKQMVAETDEENSVHDKGKAQLDDGEEDFLPDAKTVPVGDGSSVEVDILDDNASDSART
jgi:hypothetical protein